MNAFFVDTWLKTHLSWLAIPVGAGLWLLLAFFSFLLFGCGDSFGRLERQTCQDGKTKKSFGPDWPCTISVFLAWGVAVRAAAALRVLRGSTHFGIDLSSFSVCSLPFGFSLHVLSELAACGGLFAKCWFVPVTLCLLSYFRRIRIFRSFGSGIRYLLVQMLAVNAVYWLYGLLLAFAVMPAFVGLFCFVKGIWLVAKDWLVVKVVCKLLLLAVLLVLVGLGGILPFMTGHWLVGGLESMLFYKKTGSHRGIGWLPVSGSAIVAAIAAVPVGWRNLLASGSDKLGFFGGPKATWTATVFHWSWAFELPQGTAAVYARMHWGIPVLLAVAAFVLRIRAFKGIFSAMLQFIAFTAAAYATAAFYGAFYGAFFFMAIVGLLLGAGVTATSSGHAYTSGTSDNESLDDAEERRKKEEEDQRQRDEEYNRTHKTLLDGTEIEDHGVFGWSDRWGNTYRENGDETFTRDE